MMLMAKNATVIPTKIKSHTIVLLSKCFATIAQVQAVGPGRLFHQPAYLVELREADAAPEAFKHGLLVPERDFVA